MPDQTHEDFLQQNPLSFGLYNYYERNDYNLLYINDNPDDLRFNLEIKNLSTKAINLRKSTQSDIEAPSSNNYHIELKFRPNQLSQRSREKIDLSEVSKDGWSMSRPYENRDRTVSLFLLKRKEDLVIEQQRTQFITLVGLGANSIEGARVTQLEINYKDFYLAQEKSDENANAQRNAIDPQRQIIILTVLNHSGERAASLTVTFAYAPTLLNTGSEFQSLLLQIVNVGQDVITLNEKSKFEITIDVEGNKEEAWALAKKDETEECEIFVGKNIEPSRKASKEGYWVIEKSDSTVEDPTWIIKPNFAWKREDEQARLKQFTLKQNEDLFITINKLKTSLRSGIGNLHIAYYNLPGYMDKKIILGVTKTCITEQKESGVGSGRIGINKLPDPETNLDVKGKIASDSLVVKHDVSVENSLAVQNKLTTNSIEIKKEVEGSLTVQNKLTTNSIEIKKEVEGSLTVQNNVRAQSFSGIGALTLGMIIMWVDNDFKTMNGPSIPDGYALCNGRHGTPDLRQQFKSCGGNKALFYLMKVDRVISEVVLDPIFGTIRFTENKEWKTNSGCKLAFIKQEGDWFGKLKLTDKSGTTYTIYDGYSRNDFRSEDGSLILLESISIIDVSLDIQNDGNFCIYVTIEIYGGIRQICVWASDTNNKAQFLVLEDDGKIGGYSEKNGMTYLEKKPD